MKKRGIKCIALLLALALTACAGAEPTASPEESIVPTPTLTPPAVETAMPFALPYYPGASMHPLYTDSATNLALMPLLYEGLFEITADWEAEPLLCEAAVCDESATRWTFTIRQGVTFSDGSRLTAALVRDGLLAAARADSLYAARLADVVSVRATEEYTVEVTLAAPNGALPLLLDVPIVLTGENPLGTGPYVLDGERLRRRVGWWRGQSRPAEEIPLYSLTSADDMIYAFDSGAISAVPADFTAANALGYAGSYEVWEYGTASMLYLGFRTNGGPCENSALRAAMAEGIARTTIAETLLAGHATPTSLPTPTGGWGYDHGAPLTADTVLPVLEGALDAAGYAKGEDGTRRDGRQPLALTFVVNTDNSFKVAIAAHIAETLRAAGVEVELRTLAWEEYLSALGRGNFDLYLGESRLTADFDLSALILRDGALNYGKYHDAETAQRHADWRAAVGDARVTAASALYTRMLAEAPIAPICFKSASLVTRWGRVRGAAPTQQNLFYAIDGWRIVG